MKARFQSLWDRLFYKPEPLKPGIYQKTISNEGKPPFRVHLRIEKDGRGILVLNAKTVLHLNQTAAEYALLMIHESSNDVVAQAIEKRYRITRDEALSDYQKFVDQLEVLKSGTVSPGTKPFRIIKNSSISSKFCERLPILILKFSSISTAWNPAPKLSLPLCGWIVL